MVGEEYYINNSSNAWSLASSKLDAEGPPKAKSRFSLITSGLGQIATRAEQILNKSISINPEIFTDRLKTLIPSLPPPNQESVVDQDQKIKDVVHRSNEIIASAQTVWPFTLFTDDIFVDRTKVSITKRSFFFISEVMSIRLEDILNVKVSLGPFFGSITLVVRILSSEDHHTINFLKRRDAIMLKHIIQGYIIALHNNIDCTYQDRQHLIATLNDLGHDKA